MENYVHTELVAQFGAQAEKAVALLKSMANEARLLVLCHLSAEGELSVGQLQVRVGLGQSALSQHLANIGIPLMPSALLSRTSAKMDARGQQAAVSSRAERRRRIGILTWGCANG